MLRHDFARPTWRSMITALNGWQRSKRRLQSNGTLRHSDGTAIYNVFCLNKVGSRGRLPVACAACEAG